MSLSNTLPGNKSTGGFLIQVQIPHLTAAEQHHVDADAHGERSRATIAILLCFVQLWPWLPVISGYFYGIKKHSRNGVTC